jgi:hypothetical protein
MRPSLRKSLSEGAPLVLGASVGVEVADMALEGAVDLGRGSVVATFDEAALDELGSEPGDCFGALIAGHRLNSARATMRSRLSQ